MNEMTMPSPECRGGVNRRIRTLKRVLPAVLSLLALAAHADPPRVGSLSGPWWEEKGKTLLDIGVEGDGYLMDCERQASRQGRFSVSTPGKLVFTVPGSDGLEWTMTLSADSLVLTSKDGTEQRFHRESRECREARCGRLLVEAREFEDALKRPDLKPPAAEQARKRVVEIHAQTSVLVKSLAGDNPKAQEVLLERLFAAHSPEALEAGRLAMRETDCCNHLKQIGVYLLLYESKHRTLAKSLEDLKHPELASDESLFTCPVSRQRDAYVYVAPARGIDTPEDAVVVYDRDAHPNGLRCVLTFGGPVTRLDDGELKKALKAGTAAVRPKVTIDSAQFAKTPEGLVLTVQGHVEGLRVERRDGSAFVSATLSLGGFGKREEPYDSGPFPVSGTPESQPLKFTVKLNLAGESQDRVSISLTLKDDARGDRINIPLRAAK